MISLAAFDDTFAGFLSMPASQPDRAYHVPVLTGPIVELLAPAPGGLALDATLGGGGHAAAFLAAGARVVGIDQDPDAIEFATQRLNEAGDRFLALRGSFSHARALLMRAGISRLDAALVDCGVSSHQLDTAERGFSFQKDGPLDMRMSPDAPMTAADAVNTLPAEELAHVFREFGEEPAARKIAAALVRQRATRPFTRTLELAEAVERVVPRHGRAHPATRVFQALRIYTNREMEALALGLAEISACLAPRARFGVVTFHSLEDRLVKAFFRHCATEWLDAPEWPAPRRNPDHIFRAITKKPIVASEEEIRTNPRARSAKLRVVERLA